MGKLPSVTYAEFNEILNSETKFIIVDCWAPWCGPCRSIEPYYEQLSVEYNDRMRFIRMNMDEDPIFAQKYMISSLPTFVVFKEKKPYSNLIGADRKKLKKLIDVVLDKK